MPVYLLHGFRWPREGLSGIRVRTIIHDLEDVSADYIQNTNSQAALLESFRKEFPDIMANLPNLILLEQYDPEDVTSPDAVCQPYAFVGDRVVTIAGGGPNTVQRPLSEVIQDGSKMPASHGAKKTDKGEIQGKAMSPSPKSRDTALSVNVEDVMASGPGVSPAAWEALADLRDKVAVGEKIGWFVVYNGDPERKVDHDEYEEDDEVDYDDAQVGGISTETPTTPSHKARQPSGTSLTSPGTRDRSTSNTALPVREKGTGMRKPSMTVGSPTEKALPPEPLREKEKPSNKSPSLKKFFGKKEKSIG